MPVLQTSHEIMKYTHRHKHGYFPIFMLTKGLCFIDI